jgi:hypothetical protein
LTCLGPPTDIFVFPEIQPAINLYQAMMVTAEEELIMPFTLQGKFRLLWKAPSASLLSEEHTLASKGKACLISLGNLKTFPGVK